MYGTDHHELRVQPSALEVLPRLVWHYGEPFADHSAIPSFYLAQLTRGHVTVALNGDGGDENFAGYYRYLRRNRSERLAALRASPPRRQRISFLLDDQPIMRVITRPELELLQALFGMTSVQ